MSAAPALRRHVLTAHQPAYLPWLGYFDKIARADRFIVFDGVPMESSGYENRNRVKVGSTAQWLTVPVKRSRDVQLKDVFIANEHGWARKHYRTLEMAYQKAPYWDLYRSRLHSFYIVEYEKLADLNVAMLRFFLNALDINTPVERASSYDFQGSKSDLVLDMCVKLGATDYWFGEHGESYADVPAFLAAGVTPRFQKYEHPTYPQMGGGFISHLSALDLLFNVGPGSLKVIRG